MATDAVFLDTDGWIALLNSSDQLHRQAERIWRPLADHRTRIVLTDWIIAETGNGLARTAARTRFREAVELIQSSPRAELVRISPDLLGRSLKLYQGRSDKTWGLVDCPTMTVMTDRGTLQTFTNDRHFHQAGFQCLLPIP